MNKKCTGCGIVLQSINIDEPGYIENPDSLYCRRCFRLKNYGEYLVFNKDNKYFKELLNNISDSKHLLVHVIDILSIGSDDLFDKIKSNSILVLSKKDVLMKSIKEEKLIENIKRVMPGYLDYIVISSNKNYNIDLLIKKINKYKKDKYVYFVGYTNSGKSTLINKIIDNNSLITTSYYPSTTQDIIEIKIDKDLIILDTPGILQSGNIINSIDLNQIKKISLNKEMKPKIFQIKKETSIVIDDFCKINLKDDNDMVIYSSDRLNIFNRNISNNLFNDKFKRTFSVLKNEELVISGLCFISFKNNTTIDIYIDEKVFIYKRFKLI